MQRIFLYLLIRFFLRWDPGRKGGFSLDAPDNNFLFIRVFGLRDDAPDKSCKVVSVTAKAVQCGYFDDEVETIEVPLTELLNYEIRPLYYGPGFGVQYDTLFEPIFDLVTGMRIRMRRQSRFDNKVSEYRDRIGVLKHCVHMHEDRIRKTELSLDEALSGLVPITINQLLNRVYGELLLSSKKYDSYRQLMIFRLRALIDSGEISEFPGDQTFTRFAVLPKSINTLAQHELDMKMQRASRRPAYILIFVTLIYVVIAGIDVWQASRSGGDRSPVSESSDTASVPVAE